MNFLHTQCHVTGALYITCKNLLEHDPYSIPGDRCCTHGDFWFLEHERFKVLFILYLTHQERFARTEDRTLQTTVAYHSVNRYTTCDTHAPLKVSEILHLNTIVKQIKNLRSWQFVIFPTNHHRVRSWKANILQKSSKLWTKVKENSPLEAPRDEVAEDLQDLSSL